MYNVVFFLLLELPPKLPLVVTYQSGRHCELMGRMIHRASEPSPSPFMEGRGGGDNMKVYIVYYCNVALTYMSAAFSLNALANGLLVIFSCVT